MENKIILETDRLIIRELSLNDAELLLKYSQEDITKKELPDEVFDNIEEVKEIINIFINNYNSENKSSFPLVYGVVLKDSNLLIGHVSLSEIDKGIEIGYAIATEYLNNGYASEIITPFTIWAKEYLGVNKIYAIAKKENIPSWKALEKNGFIFLQEGVFNNYFEGKYITRVYYK